MSNVLIGIIGVILFIGLALAGALFLGPRFQESTNNSRASAAVQAVAQVSNAANMYKVQEGKDVAGSGVTPATQLQSDSYLKSVPTNPTGEGDAAAQTAGTFKVQVQAVPTTAGTIRYVTMKLSTNATAVCDAINKQSGVATAPATPTGTQGCTSDQLAYSAI